MSSLDTRQNCFPFFSENVYLKTYYRDELAVFRDFGRYETQVNRFLNFAEHTFKFKLREVSCKNQQHWPDILSKALLFVKINEFYTFDYTYTYFITHLSSKIDTNNNCICCNF